MAPGVVDCTFPLIYTLKTAMLLVQKSWGLGVLPSATLSVKKSYKISYPLGIHASSDAFQNFAALSKLAKKI